MKIITTYISHVPVFISLRYFTLSSTSQNDIVINIYLEFLISDYIVYKFKSAVNARESVGN